MLKAFMGERYFCGLDIGAQSIKAALLKARENYKPGLLGVYETRTSGYQKASVTDLGELSECVLATISGLAQKTGIKLKEVELGVAGGLVESRSSSAVIPLLDRGNKIITSHDVRKVQSQAKLLGVNMEEAILHSFPQFYKVDDVNIALNPVGLYGRKLEIHTLLLLGKNTVLKNLAKAVNQAGYDVANLFFTSFTAAHTTLNEQQKRQGCVLVDVGASLTTILIFKDGQLKYFKDISLGGEQVTRSIANELTIALDLAEDIKKSYANAISAENRSHEEVLIKRDDGYLPVKKERISAAIEPVIVQIIDAITQTINTSGFRDQINTGIVMIGGGSLLPGLAERIEKAMELPVTLGEIDIAVKRLHNAAKYAGAVGLAQTGLIRSLGATSPAAAQLSRRARLVNKVKEVYQEYF